MSRLRIWQTRWRLVETFFDAFRAPANAMEGRKYGIEELLEQPAGLALFHWLACLHAAVHQAFEADGDNPAPLRSGILSDDYASVSVVLGRCGAAFWLAGDVMQVAATIVPLVSDRKAFGAVRRVTTGYGKLLQEELAIRGT